jgi:2-haloacid dehalogenase
MEYPRAVLFDAFGTLFDVYSVSHSAEQLFPGRGVKLSLLWRDKQLEYTRLLTMSGRYRPFWDVTRAALRFALQRFELPATQAQEDLLMNQYRHLSPFPENKAVLETLKARGIPAGILSNGDPPMLEVAIKSAGFEPLLSHVLSVDAVRKFKTDPAAYALGPQALKLPARQILFVSSNGWDAVGATWYGYTTLWVNRGGLPAEQLDTAPTRTGRSLSDVIDCFPPLPPRSDRRKT